VVAVSLKKKFYAAIRYHGYYESSNGINWSRLANQPASGLTQAQCPSNFGSSNCPILHGALTVQPVTGDMFALTTDRNNIDQGLRQDACQLTRGACQSGTVQFGIPLSSTALDAGPTDKHIAQADYNLWLAAVPVPNDTILFAGTQDIFRCTVSSGCAWRNATNANTCAAARVAPAQHAVDITFASSLGLAYFGNDGGLWRTTDNLALQPAPCTTDDAVHFQNLNGSLGSLAAVTDLASDPSEPTTLLAAFGAAGTAAISPIHPAWTQVFGGEGSRVAIDPANSLNWLTASSVGVSIHACALGGACNAATFGNLVVGSTQVGGDGNGLSLPAPWMLDPQDTSKVIVGTCRVWRGPAANSAAWSSINQLSPMLDGVNQAACNGNTPLRTLAASGTVSNLAGTQQLLYAGMAGALDGGGPAPGHLYQAAISSTSDASTPWTDISKSLVVNDMGTPNLGKFNPGAFAISSIAIDPHDTTGETAYVTIPAFSGNKNISEPLIYATTDGGAHWNNFTGNLPIVPANTILVDPDDANTVYVGLDVGVYVTRQISTCYSVANQCWSLYGTGLPNAPIVRLTPFKSASNSFLRVATYGRGIWQIPLASAQSTLTTATLAPTSLSFPDQPVQTAGSPQTLTLTNSGSIPLTITQITVGADFAESDNCGGSVAAGGSCTLQLTFLPTQLGALAETLTILGNLPGRQLTSSLSGNGVAGAAIVLLPTMMSFGSAVIGTTTAAQNLTISNTGGIPVRIGIPGTSGDFQLSVNTCGASLPVNTGCTVSIRFAPTASGERTGTFTISDDLGTQTAQLSGTGQSGATDLLSPPSLVFADQVVHPLSPAQPVNLSNNGDISLDDIRATVTGVFHVDSIPGTV
jgi:hypothetical protein